MNIKDYIQSKSFKDILTGILIAIIALVIFQAGVAMGERKASFGHRFGDNFERNFKDPRGGFAPPDFLQDMPSGHGAAGEIVSVTLPLVVVAGSDKLEKTIVITDTTTIRKFRDTVEAKDLSVGDFVVILGTPNTEGQIDARLIRLVPPPQTLLDTKPTQ